MILGFVLGVLLTSGIAYATAIDKIQVAIGQLMVANAQLQDQYETATKKLSDCEKEHTSHKKEK